MTTALSPQSTHSTHSTHTVSGTELKAAVGHFPSGVTVVTTHAQGVDIGLTVSSFISVSLEPAHVLVSIERSSSSLGFLEVGAPIGISILAEHQAAVARQFASRRADRFSGISIERADNGVAWLRFAAASVAGHVAARYPGGDHELVLVAVEQTVIHNRRPLVYHRGELGAR